MSALLITLLRFGFLALLWIFVFVVVVTVRRDLFGTSIRSRGKNKNPAKKSSKKAKTNTQHRLSTSSEPMLVVLEGPLIGTRLSLTSGSITVGRSPDSSLVVDDGYASSRHARFYRDANRIIVEDLNSTNGTWIGGVQITQPTVLPAGVPVTIGKTTMEVQA